MAAHCQWRGNEGTAVFLITRSWFESRPRHLVHMCILRNSHRLSYVVHALSGALHRKISVLSIATGYIWVIRFALNQLSNLFFTCKATLQHINHSQSCGKAHTQDSTPTTHAIPFIEKIIVPRGATLISGITPSTSAHNWCIRGQYFL